MAPPGKIHARARSVTDTSSATIKIRLQDTRRKPIRKGTPLRLSPRSATRIGPQRSGCYGCHAMALLDCIVQPCIDPLSSVATDRHLMQALCDPSRHTDGILRIYALPGDVLSLGRYHLAPDVSSPGGVRAGAVTLVRRLSGGRVWVCGDGFVGLSLILPHRSALVARAATALAPHQVSNRYVRGLLEACRLHHVPVIYPGRDLVTIHRRAVAALSFETDARGVLLFEVVIAITRAFDLIPAFLDSVDREGVVKADMPTSEGTTSLSRELGTEIPFAGVVEMLCDGYAKQLGLRLEPRELTDAERQAIALAEHDLAPERWLYGRRRAPELDRHVSAWTQLGALEAYFSLANESTIREITFAGDFIANSTAIDALERELRSCPVDREAIHAVVTRIFSRPENYLLGIGRLETIAEMIVGGRPS